MYVSAHAKVRASWRVHYEALMLIYRFICSIKTKVQAKMYLAFIKLSALLS